MILVLVEVVRNIKNVVVEISNFSLTKTIIQGV